MLLQENKSEYVQLYCDYILNKSIESQYNAFKKGFQLVIFELKTKFIRPDCFGTFIYFKFRFASVEFWSFFMPESLWL